MAKEVERTSFIGLNVPQEVKICVKNFNKFDEDKFADLINVAQKHLTNNPSVEEEFEICAEKYGEEVILLYPGLLKILQAAIRIPQYSLNANDFVKDLTSLGILKKYHEKFVEVVFGPGRANIDSVCLNSKPRYPTLDSFRWRVDVAISTAKLSRVLEPSIVMKIKTSDGKVKTFEVSKEKFHELRYAVAYVLKQMQQIEKRSVLQIKS